VPDVRNQARQIRASIDLDRQRLVGITVGEVDNRQRLVQLSAWVKT
jgi:hypothetical protein